MIQIWFMAVTLKTWQVKTICPAGWSEEEGEGTEVAAESGFEGLVVGVATGVKALKTGAVFVASAATGDEYPSGVDACSVANRLESCVAGAANRLQPSIKNSAAAIHKSLFFFRIQFDRFKLEFLTRQYFCTVAAAIGAVDFSVQRLVFAEARHTLYFCFP